MAERALSAAVLAAIAAGTVRPFLLYEGEYLSGGATAYLRLFTGVGTLSWDGKDWVGGRDLLAISPIRESTSLEAIGFSVRLSGLPADKLSLFLQSMRKNKAGRLWLGFVGREVVESGTAQAGAADTLTLAAGASAEVNAHARKILSLTTGPGSVQEREVASYDGSTKVATVSPAWENYLNVPITPGAGATTPDSVANSITGDIDIRVKAQLADWTVSVATRTRFVWKRGATPAYDFYLDANTLGFYMGNAATATVVLPFEDNSTHWVRATRTAADGVVKFYTSDDGVDWTQLGADRATPAVALNDTTDQLRIAGDGTLNSINGKLFYLEIRDGIDGSVAAKFDPAEADADASFVASTGETWTIVGGASLLRLPDATTGYEVIDENGVIADPYPLRRGRFDVAPITRDPGSGTVTIEARYEGPLARLLVPNVRHYTHEDQQLRLAGDKGFDQVEALQDTQDLWGPEVPVYPATTRSPRQPPELS